MAIPWDGWVLLGVLAAYGFALRVLWVGALQDFGTDVQILCYWITGKDVRACPAQPLPCLIDLIFAISSWGWDVRTVLFGTLAVVLLYRSCRLLGSAPWFALLVLLAYLLCPALLDIAHRTAENLP